MFSKYSSSIDALKVASTSAKSALLRMSAIILTTQVEVGLREENRCRCMDDQALPYAIKLDDDTYEGTEKLLRHSISHLGFPTVRSVAVAGHTLESHLQLLGSPLLDFLVSLRVAARMFFTLPLWAAARDAAAGRYDIPLPNKINDHEHHYSIYGMNLPVTMSCVFQGMLNVIYNLSGNLSWAIEGMIVEIC